MINNISWKEWTKEIYYSLKMMRMYLMMMMIVFVQRLTTDDDDDYGKGHWWWMMKIKIKNSYDSKEVPLFCS